jgi:hypothetical protein
VARAAAALAPLLRDHHVIITYGNGPQAGLPAIENAGDLVATSSDFGNMFSAAFSSVFLKLLPMLPSQILLNNLLYDSGQLAIPTDNVDPEQQESAVGWDIGFVRHFMYVPGPLSSIFNFITFWVMFSLLHGGPPSSAWAGSLTSPRSPSTGHSARGTEPQRAPGAHRSARRLRRRAGPFAAHTTGRSPRTHDAA